MKFFQSHFSKTLGKKSVAVLLLATFLITMVFHLTPWTKPAQAEETITGSGDGWSFSFVNQLDGEDISNNIPTDKKPSIIVDKDFEQQTALNDIPSSDGSYYYELVGLFLTQTNGTPDTSDDIIREISEVRHIGENYYGKVKGSKQNYIVFNKTNAKLTAYYRTHYKMTIHAVGDEFLASSVDEKVAKLQSPVTVRAESLR